MTEWKPEENTRKPEELQVIGDALLMQRRNIEQKERSMDYGEGEETQQYYSCECRELTVSEYMMLQSIEEIDASKAIDAYTMQLIEEGVL